MFSIGTMSMNRTQEILLSFDYTSVLKRLVIIFGSIGCLWSIIGLIFLSMQTYQQLIRRKTSQKLFPFERAMPVLALLEAAVNDEQISSNESNQDDRMSVLTSVSILSDMFHEQHSPSVDSTSSSAIRSACRNLAYSQSNDSSLHNETDTRSSRVFQRQSSTITLSSQRTNVTHLSSISSSTKSAPLPVVMITDCDRLQTDIIELEHFEPETAWPPSKSVLRLLLNDRMPQAMR